jgi:NtrC-family two-component system sensor histidine kinase KinB
MRRASLRARLWFFSFLLLFLTSLVTSLALDLLGNRPKSYVYLAIILTLGILSSGYFVIRSVTHHLQLLGEILDNVNVEDDLPLALAGLKSDIPEFSVITQKFKHLLEKLHDYRAMNVRRLLIEKRRADIIAASITDGIYLLRDDQILYTNPVAQRILGLQEGFHTQAMNLRTLAETSEKSVKAIRSAISQTMPVEFILDTNGSTSYYLLQSYPISYDLIEQIEHDPPSSLRSTLDHFQANIVVVAQDVTLVRESQDAKGHFLGTLSHEVKTPVTSLMLAIRLLNKSVDQFSPMHQSLIKTCVDDIERLRCLLDELLNVSRFDSLAQRLQLQSVDLVKFLRRTVESSQPSARDRDVSLSFEVVNGSGDEAVSRLLLSFDPTKLAWAFTNLLTNAMRHSPRGGKVETKIVYSNDEWVEVRVRDHGNGIEAKRQPRIFDKFSPHYELNVARTGTAGMGLSVAREIITAHGGRIWVNSELGKGAEFCFTLPTRERGAGTFTGPVAAMRGNPAKNNKNDFGTAQKGS